MNYTENYSLKDCTTFHLPVKCKYFCEYNSVDELKEILQSDIYKSNTTFHMGGGSNLLFTKDFDGLVLHSKINFIETIEESDDFITLKVGSGVDWDSFVKYCVEHEYYGIENMSFIPGECGASAVQNIGSYGVEVKDVITKVYCINRNSCIEEVFSNEQCKYDYRDSIFKNEQKDKYFVVAVEYKLSKRPKFSLEYGALKSLQQGDVSIEQVREAIIDIRTNKLPNPKVIGSAGSFFKNPIVSVAKFNDLLSKYPTMPHYVISDELIKIPAGWLIENAGLKGFSKGDAAVYEKQCLVIVNNGCATSQQVVDVYTHVIDVVDKMYGIKLSPEANIL